MTPTPDIPDDVLELARQVAALDPAAWDIAESSAVVHAVHGPRIAGAYCEHLDSLIQEDS